MLRTSAWFMLLVFGLSALSPSYAQFRGRCDACLLSETPSSHDLGHDLRVGILWVDVLLESIAGAGEERDPALGGQFLRPLTDEDMVLIKRKRAIAREEQAARPHFRIGHVGADDILPRVPPFLSYDILHDPVHRHTDGYHTLHAGVPPPPCPSLS